MKPWISIFVTFLLLAIIVTGIIVPTGCASESPGLKLTPVSNAYAIGDITINVDVTGFNIVDKLGQAAVKGEGHLKLFHGCGLRRLLPDTRLSLTPERMPVPRKHPIPGIMSAVVAIPSRSNWSTTTDYAAYPFGGGITDDIDSSGDRLTPGGYSDAAQRRRASRRGYHHHVLRFSNFELTGCCGASQRQPSGACQLLYGYGCARYTGAAGSRSGGFLRDFSAGQLYLEECQTRGTHLFHRVGE